MLTNDIVGLHFCPAQSHVKERLESRDRLSLVSPVSKQRPLCSRPQSIVSRSTCMFLTLRWLPRIRYRVPSIQPGRSLSSCTHHKWLSARPYCNACLNTHKDSYRLSSSLDVLLGKEPPWKLSSKTCLGHGQRARHASFGTPRAARQSMMQRRS